MSIDYSCKICNKYYKSYQTLWKHNKTFHINNVKKVKENVKKVKENVNNVEETIKEANNNIIKSLTCELCNKQFNSRPAKSIHKKKCTSIIIEIDKELQLAKENNIRLKTEAKILQLKIKLQKSEKIDNITLRQLNKKLMQRNNLIKNSPINSNNTQIINNFNLIGLGKEEIFETLTNHEKKMIMNAKYSSLDKLIEIIHCGKYNQFKNIIITNMKDNYMYKYDDKLGHFILSTKTDVINSLIDYRLGDLEIIYNDLLDKNKLDEKTKDIIEKFINKINNDESKYTDYDGIQHENYKQYKIHEIKILLFNNQDKITNDISLLLTTNDVTQDLIL